jgi:protein TonB
VEGAARTIDYAVLASIALHGLALFGVSAVNESKHRRASAAEPIAARLAEPVPAAPTPVEERRVRPKIVKSTAIPGPAPALEETIEVKTAPVSASATPPVAVQVPAAPPGEAASPPADAATIGQYRVQLIGAARRFKRYPEVARENNWAGNVVVGVAVGADGRPGTNVRKSSGRSVLDQQALEMFQQAARAVPIPPALRGKEFSLEVRAIYGLED